MVDLFFRTASQALQAFLPIAFALAVFRRRGQHDAVSGICWGIGAAAIATVPAGWIFQRSVHQSLWESMLALLALGSIAWVIRENLRSRRIPALMLAAMTAYFVTRQTMEIGAVLLSAFELRSLAALAAIGGAASLSAAVAGFWIWFAGRCTAKASAAATRMFLVLCVSQLAMYAFHESAEARLLPWSETLHAATEPYGPDGVYGRYFSWLLVLMPLAWAGAMALRHRWQFSLATRPVTPRRYLIAAACVLLVAIAGGLSRRSAATTPVPAGVEILAATSAPHILFRHTQVDQGYGSLAIALLADPSGRRQSLGMPCERVAFAAGHGLCLQALRGVFTTYRAVLFDQQFNTVRAWDIGGSPSRTRVAHDGRVGAITVFVTGHGYGASPFSTKTTLVDMQSGDTLGDLEQFSTWRNGARIKAQDFNFWGVTFAADSNNFYATLGTAGKTYLVKGDLGLRKLTVQYAGVECPSLSPDGRLIAFKKRVGAGTANWRLAILDLATMTERPLAGEPRNIDDQAEWLDNERVLYSVPRDGSAVTDVWIAPVNTAGPSRTFLAGAESPAVVGD